MARLSVAATIVTTLIVDPTFGFAGAGPYGTLDSDFYQAAFRPNSSSLRDHSLYSILGVRQEQTTCTLPEPWVECPDGVYCCPLDEPNCVSMFNSNMMYKH